jgi:hypothetical protein
MKERERYFSPEAEELVLLQGGPLCVSFDADPLPGFTFDDEED